MKISKIIAVAALALAPVAVSASTIDLTKSSTFTGATATSVSGATVGGVTWTITGRPADSLNFSQLYDGPAGATGGLAEELDGIGIVDDEISNVEGELRELLFVEFSAPVAISGFHFLDLFCGERCERMLVWVNEDTPLPTPDFVVVGDQPVGSNGGYKFFAQDIFNVSTLTFSVRLTNDGQGVADAALAGIDVIPLPASALLLLGGLGGIAALKRRRKAA